MKGNGYKNSKSLLLITSVIHHKIPGIADQQAFTSHNLWKLQGFLMITLITLTVYVKSVLVQITRQGCGKQNGMPPYSHCHPCKAIGQPLTHVGSGWHTSETEKEEGGAQSTWFSWRLYNGETGASNWGAQGMYISKEWKSMRKQQESVHFWTSAK